VEQTLAGHTQGDVTDIMYTADGSRLFTAGRDGLVKLWDAETGEELRTFTGHTAAVVKIALSADGTRLATAGADSTAKVWDIETGEELQTFVGHNLWVFGVAFSPDGERLATAAEDGLVKIWDIATGVEQLNLDGHSDWVNELSFTPDGARLITASSDGTVKVWDASTGRELASLTGHDNGVFGMAFSPDWSAMVTESFDQTIKVWDLAQVESGGSDALLLTVDRNTNATSNATRITFSPDGLRILALEDDSITSEWDVASGQLLRRIPCGAGNGFTIAVSPDGEHLAAASELGQATICSLLPAGELLALELADDVYDVNLSPDGTRLYAAAGGDGIKVWNFDQSDAETFGQLVGSVDAGEAGVFFKAIASQDGSQVAIAGADGITRILASDSLEELMTLSGHDHIVTDTTFNHAGSRLATASFDNKGKMWDLESGQELFTLDGHSDAVIQIIFSEDEKYLVTSSFDGTARIWDAETGQELQKLDLGISVRPLSFSPDGRILAIGSGNEIVLYDFTGWVESGVMRELGRLSGHTGSLIAAHFSPSGKYLATGATDHSAKIWDVATGRTLTTLEGNENWVRDVEFSLDESMLVTAGADGTVRAYYLDPDTLSEVAQSRLTRWFTPLECQEYLNSDECPPAPWEDGN